VHARGSVARRSMRRALHGGLSLVACAAVTAGAAAQSDGGGGGGPSAEAPIAAEKWLLERTALRESPVEQDRRRSSRTAYADQSDAGALGTARAEQRALVATPVWRPVPNGATVETFLGDHSARVRIGGRSSFVESLTPLRTRDEAGEKAPVDLSLVRRAGGFAMRNPLVPVGLPETAGGWVAFERSGVRFRHDVGRSDVRASEVDGRLHYANVDVDTDLLALPQPNGVETFLVLRSASSPEDNAIELDLPDGAELRAHPQAAGAVQVVRGDDVLVSMLPPLGWDADGEPFPVTYEPSGSRVLVRFAHRERDLRYPIVVDPMTTAGFYDEGTSLGAWGKRQKANNWQFRDDVCTGCLYLNTLGSSSYATGDWAEWFYTPPGTTAYAWRLDAYTNFDNGNSAGMMYQGLLHPSTGWWKAYWEGSPGVSSSGDGPSYTRSSHENYLQRHSLGAKFEPPVGTDNQKYHATQAVLALYMADAKLFPGYIVQANFFTTLVFVDDTDAPTIERPSGQPAGWIASWPEGAGKIAAPARAGDTGMGVKELQIWAPKVGGGSQTIEPEKHPCDGTWTKNANKRCPSSWGPGDEAYDALSYSVAELPEGVNTLSLRSYDLSAHASPAASWPVKVDRTPPDVALSGPLYDARGTTVTPDRTYRLTTVVSEGTDAAPRSGGDRVEVYVDPVTSAGTVRMPVPVFEADNPNCGDAQQNCRYEAAYDFDPNDFEPGTYDIRVIGKDQPRHATTRTFRVTVPSPTTSDEVVGLEKWATYEELETGAGSRAYANLQSGNAVWQTTPVRNPGRGLTTLVDLTYNAHEHSAPQASPGDGVADTPTRPEGFSIGASGLTRVNEPLDVSAAALGGPALLIDRDGTRHRFAQAGSTFTAPPGVHLHLRKLITTPEDRTWAVTEPDGTTHYFDRFGYQTWVRDRDDNWMRFDYERHPGAGWQAGRCSTLSEVIAGTLCEQRLVGVVDPAGTTSSPAANRTVALSYWAAADTTPGALPGRLKDVIDHGGRVTRFHYDLTGRLVELVEAHGVASSERRRTFTYTGATPELATVVDPRGNATQLAFGVDLRRTDARRQLQSWTDRSGNATTFAYTTTSATVRASLSRTWTYDIDARGRAPRFTSASGTTTLGWDGRNMLRRVTEASGTSDEATSRMDYNHNGLLLNYTDPLGRRTELRYRDTVGYPVHSGESAGTFVSDLETITRPKGTATSTAGDYTTTFSLDAQNRGRVLARRDAEGHSAAFAYDALGQVTQRTDEVNAVTKYESYDANGLPRVIRDGRNGRWLYCYDAVGNVTRVTDPRGAQADCADADHRYQTRLTYDALDRLVAEAAPKRSIDGVYVARSFEYDPNGNPVASVDANGERSEQAFTAMDAIAEQRTPPSPHAGEAGSEPEVTQYSYDAALRLAKITAPNGAATATDDDYATSYVYDTSDRLVTETRHSRGSTTKDLVSSYAYDRRDNMIGRVDPKRNARYGGDPVDNAQQPARRRFTYEYDKADNRTAQVEDPGALVLRTEWGYDANDNVAKEIAPRAFKTGGTRSAYTTTYIYDDRDLLEAIIDPRGGRSAWVLRGDGRPTSVTSPRGTETGTSGDFETRYSYYATGELESVTLPRASGQYGSEAKFSYVRDAVGDPTTITDGRGKSFTNTFYDTGHLRTTQRPSFWIFDPNGPGSPNTSGAGASDAGPALPNPRAGSRGDDHPVRERSWQELVALAAAEQQDGGDLPETEGIGDFGAVEPEALPDVLPRAGKAPDPPTELVYDAEMRLTNVIDSARHGTTVSYDPQDRITQISQPLDLAAGRRIVRGFEYDRNGNLKIFRDPEQHVSEYEYDQFDRVVTERVPGTDANPLEVTRLTYDDNGNLESRETPRGAAFTYAYGYDDADRMVSATNPASDRTTYGYDANGNQTMERSPRGNADGLSDTSCAADHQQRECYTTRRTFDALDRLQTETNGLGNATSLDYDANGNQTKVTAPGARSAPGGAVTAQVTEREYDGRDLPWTQTTGSGSEKRTVVTEYDGMANLRRVVRPRGVEEPPRRPVHADTVEKVPSDSTATKHAVVREYDADGLLTAIHMPWGDRDATDAARHRMDFTRDRLGRVESIDSPYQWAAACDPGNLARDPNCTTRTSYTHYDSGWIRSSSDPELQDPDTSTPIYKHNLEYDYDARGNQKLWRTVHAGSHGREVERTFYPNGLLRRRSAARLKPDSTEAESRRTYTYDYTANRALSSLVDANRARTTRVEHDAADRPTLVNETWSDSRDTTFRYDRNGNVTRRQTDGRFSPTAEDPDRYLGGKTTSHEHDPIDREAKTSVNPAGSEPARTTTTTYYASSQVEKRSKSWNGVDELFYYQDDGRATEQRRRKGTAVASAGDQTYAYDRNGNAIRDERGTHEFNSRDHLVRWTRAADRKDGSTTVTYTVNGAGAVTKKSDTAGEFDITTVFHYVGDRLDTSQATAETQTAYARYCYDAFGATTSIRRSDASAPTCSAAAPEDTTRYSYDEFERLVNGKGPGVADEVTYRYDALDRRDERVRGATTYDYTYVGLSEALTREEQRSGGAKTYDYDSRMQRLGQDHRPASGPPKFRSYATDLGGSVLALEDEQGAAPDCKPGEGGCFEARYDYDPYGELENKALLSAEANENPFRFQGHYFDEQIETYDMRARSYRPEIGRFLTQDRYESASADLRLIADPITANRYVFAGANPVNRVENDGHYGCTGDSCKNKMIKDGGNYDTQRGRFTSGPRRGTGPGGSAWRAPPPRRVHSERVTDTGAWHESREAARRRETALLRRALPRLRSGGIDLKTVGKWYVRTTGLAFTYYAYEMVKGCVDALGDGPQFGAALACDPVLGKKAAVVRRGFSKAKEIIARASEGVDDGIGLSARTADNDALQNTLNRLYKQDPKYGGGAAGALREEARTGIMVRGKNHRASAEQNVNALEKILAGQRGPLTARDRYVAVRNLRDLQDAIRYFDSRRPGGYVR
jgi:RHS repeat-associated protein